MLQKDDDEKSPILPPISLQDIDDRNEANQTIVNCNSIGGIFLPTVGQYLFNFSFLFILYVSL